MAEPRESRGRSDVEQPRRTESETRATGRSGTQQGGGLTRRGRTGLERGWNDPFALMNALHREMDRMFENFGFGGTLLHAPFFGRDIERPRGDIERSMWSPEIEMYEKDGKLHICADLPGLEKKDVRVEFNDNVITIEGERRSEREERGWSERSYGRFFRSIPLPEGITADNAKAKFENGVLDITLDAPKQEQRSGKPIEIA